MKKYILAITLAAVVSSANSAPAYDLEKKQVDLAVTTGILSSGSIDASWYSDFQPDSTVSFNNDPALVTRLLADYYVLPFLALGAAFTYGAVVPPADIVYQDNGSHTIDRHDINVLGYCTAIKGRFILSDTVAIKPGLYLGGWSSFSSSPYARENGVAVNGSVEVQFYYYENYYFLIDTGFFSQPYGGIQDIAYVRGGPIFYFNVGLGL